MSYSDEDLAMLEEQYLSLKEDVTTCLSGATGTCTAPLSFSAVAAAQ